MISRQYCANFAGIANGCNICNIPGKSLGDIGSNRQLKEQSASDDIIKKTVAAIMEGDNAASKNLLLKLKALSLHPIPVNNCNS
jgi:hypothetical protein